MRTTAKTVIAGVSTVVLAGGIGAGLAYADPSDPTPTPTASATPAEQAKPRDEPRKRRGLLATALHGEVTLAGRQHREVVFQRGPAERASATSVTVKSADGYTATYAIGPDTKVRKNQQKASAADLQTDDRIFVVAVQDGSTRKALRIRAAD